MGLGVRGVRVLSLNFLFGEKNRQQQERNTGVLRSAQDDDVKQKIQGSFPFDRLIVRMRRETRNTGVFRLRQAQPQDDDVRHRTSNDGACFRDAAAGCFFLCAAYALGAGNSICLGAL
jgi:hypothetical protein